RTGRESLRAPNFSEWIDPQLCAKAPRQPGATRARAPGAPGRFHHLADQWRVGHRVDSFRLSLPRSGLRSHDQEAHRKRHRRRVRKIEPRASPAYNRKVPDAALPAKRLLYDPAAGNGYCPDPLLVDFIAKPRRTFILSSSQLSRVAA